MARQKKPRKAVWKKHRLWINSEDNEGTKVPTWLRKNEAFIIWKSFQNGDLTNTKGKKSVAKKIPAGILLTTKQKLWKH